MNKTENRPIRLVALPALALLAALAATGPARCSWSPGGGPDRGKVSCSALTTGRRPATSVASLLTLTWIWTALRPGETATARTEVTGLSCRARFASRVTAATSAAVSGPSDRAATMVILLVAGLPSSGAPSEDAVTLRAAEPRNRLGSLLTSLPRLGSATVARTRTTPQATATGTRNLTTNRASPASQPRLTGPPRTGRS